MGIFETAACSNILHGSKYIVQYIKKIVYIALLNFDIEYVKIYKRVIVNPYARF